jgi:hypothetical protein
LKAWLSTSVSADAPGEHDAVAMQDQLQSRWR